MSEKPIKGICVDAGSEGNPGNCFYRGVDLETGETLFEETIGMGTNNIGEFLALCHAIHYCKKNNIKTTIYTDSVTAMAWVRNKKTKSTFKGEITKRMDKACWFLMTNKFDSEVVKWKTKEWGEIPADFGRK